MHPHEHDIQQEAAPETPAPPAPAVDDPPAAAQDAAPDADAPETVVETDLEQLIQRAGKADEYLALAQRTQADFENYRKRMTRDVRAAEARGIGRLAKELLPALDNLDRAIAAVEGSDGQAEHHLTEGIRLVQSELSSALARTGIEGYAAKGEQFDPVHHEAVAQTQVEGAEAGTIVEVLQSGYRLNDLVLRPARVVVAG
ncbi:MAG TPA: nucleotide exchange factor GrpE [Solirubrobacteraceae bacterium]|nr:nucleotide exchange factor GrpE [Solirubrobacteraceae bacterium]